jgi:hypothetical protein
MQLKKQAQQNPWEHTVAEAACEQVGAAPESCPGVGVHWRCPRLGMFVQ